MADAHPTSFAGIQPSPEWAFQHYLDIRDQLPKGSFKTGTHTRVESLNDLATEFDGFVFDAFGVLNAGPNPIPGAVRRLEALQSLGKPVLVLSNAATTTRALLAAKYQSMGFALSESQIVCSRDLLERSLINEPRSGQWGVIAPLNSHSHLLPKLPWRTDVRDGVRPGQLDACDGFIFLSSEGWNESLHAALETSILGRHRPIHVANPDLVAPRGDCLTLEPGFFAHRLREKTGVQPQFFGKPYPSAFHAALEQMKGIPAHRILMVGDTLHTDILGASAAGMATLLVTDHGSLKGLNPQRCIERSGIHPDFIAPSI